MDREFSLLSTPVSHSPPKVSVCLHVAPLVGLKKAVAAGLLNLLPLAQLGSKAGGCWSFMRTGQSCAEAAQGWAS